MKEEKKVNKTKFRNNKGIEERRKRCEQKGGIRKKRKTWNEAENWQPNEKGE